MIAKAVLLALLAGLCFLYTLTLFLRGRNTEAAGGAVGLAILAVVGASFFRLGWRWGLLATAGAFVFVAIWRPVAERVAYRLLGYRTGIDTDRSRKRN